MIRVATLLVLLVALPGCDGESPTGVDGSGIYRHSGNGQQGVVGTLLAEELVVLVADEDGRAVPDRVVAFEVTEGGGRVTVESDVTDDAGLAATGLILGTSPGTVQVRAAAAGIAQPVVFAATAVLPGEEDSTGAATLAGIHIHSGDGQEGLVGTLLEEELVVVLSAADGAPVRGSVVLFEVLEGSARLVARSDVTDGSGRAGVGLVLGASPGTVIVRASVAGLEEALTFTVTSVLPEDLNAPTVPGLDDYALRFDGYQRHEVDVGLVSTTGDEYTVEAWIRVSADIPMDREGGEIVGQHAASADAKGTLDILFGRLRFLINTQDGRHHELLATEPLPLEEWVHVAGVYDGQHMRLYMDGVVVGSVAATRNITAYNQRRSTRIGGYAGTATGHLWFDGDMDEVRLWAVARTVDQLRADMHHPIDAQEGLIGYWPFDEGAGLSATDASGHGHHGMLTNYQGSGYPAWVPGVFTQIEAPGQ